MKNTSLEIHTSLTDAETVRMRALIADIHGELMRLPKTPAAGDNGSGREGLMGSWSELVQLLAVGPAPEVRECPVCANVGMRAATLCGYCWSKLRPLGSG